MRSKIDSDTHTNEGKSNACYLLSQFVYAKEKYTYKK